MERNTESPPRAASPAKTPSVPASAPAPPQTTASVNPDYDLSTPIDANATGLRQNLPGYGDAHFSLFLRKVFIKALGYSEDALSRPIIGIVNTYSAFNPCHSNVPQLIDAVKRGVQLSGGLALDFPTISLHESFSSPTSMYLRNLMSMDTEEMIQAQPVDAVVLIGGCDKTTPAQLMGGISANKPIIHLVTGPMMPGTHKGVRIGACTDCRSNWAQFRAGTIDMEDISALNEELAPTGGTCGVMGTASTMACLLVALGLMPLPAATPPAVSSARLRIAEQTGTLSVSLAHSQHLRPQTLLTRASFHNAITVLHALGGSTNAVIHLLAIANRHPALAGTITMATIDAIGRRTPLLVDLKPSGAGYMTDFHAAGGMPRLLHELAPLLDLSAMTVTGLTLRDALLSIPNPTFPQSVIRPLTSPLYPHSALTPLLFGNLGGTALLKTSAATPSLLSHRGRAVVFHSPSDLASRIDDPNLDVDASSVLVLTHIGPVGAPGMPEAGVIPIPRKLARQGVTDMVRISDGRVSGTAGGTVVVHVGPEGADAGSVLGVVRDGDWVRLDVGGRWLGVEVEEEELERRRGERQTEVQEGSPGRRVRGYRGLFLREVNGAGEGADFGFLTARGPVG
ncbi:dihydroxy-acid/6-phosphogluconate dehydratase [Podospora conica]|nr:dihydroxy-acid/6-phosphogluconate dehydratase [Schizothecium conicum]